MVPAASALVAAAASIASARARCLVRSHRAPITPTMAFTDSWSIMASYLPCISGDGLTEGISGDGLTDVLTAEFIWPGWNSGQAKMAEDLCRRGLEDRYVGLADRFVIDV